MACTTTDYALITECFAPDNTCSDTWYLSLSERCSSCGHGNGLRTSSAPTAENYESIYGLCHTPLTEGMPPRPLISTLLARTMRALFLSLSLSLSLSACVLVFLSLPLNASGDLADDKTSGVALATPMMLATLVALVAMVSTKI
eukprot:COSAG02_NODE_9695_length_2138_cov_2.597842_2_plen_144_part_00